MGLATALKHVQKSCNMFYPPPPTWTTSPPVKIDINKTYFPTGKTRYNKQIRTQPRLKINLLKNPNYKRTPGLAFNN